MNSTYRNIQDDVHTSVGDTNINFSDWDSVFYAAVVADAILNRVLHHAHVVTITGNSYRLKDHML